MAVENRKTVWKLMHAGKLVAEVFRASGRWHFDGFDGRNSWAANEPGWRDIIDAKAACKSFILSVPVECWPGAVTPAPPA
jgi:hypothetical protein